MESKSILTGIIIGIIIGGLIGFMVAPSPDISGLESQIEALEVEISNYVNQVGQLQQQVSTLEDSIEFKDTEIELLEDQVDQLEIQVTSLHDEIAEREETEDPVFLACSFSRTEDTSSLLQYWIDQANESIQIMTMLITQDELADALIDAYNRGIDVDVLIDDDWYFSSGSDYQEILDAGIDIRGDERSGLMHHKIMIIDGYVIVTGSYNWSASAEDSNDENIVILKSTTIAEVYLLEFERLWSQTTPPTEEVADEEEEEEEPEPSIMFVGSKNSDVYHYLSCRYAKNIKEENRVYFSSASEARAAGYRPCKVCTPP